jgi:hypothetical protein
VLPWNQRLKRSRVSAEAVTRSTPVESHGQHVLAFDAATRVHAVTAGPGLISGDCVRLEAARDAVRVITDRQDGEVKRASEAIGVDIDWPARQAKRDSRSGISVAQGGAGMDPVLSLVDPAGGPGRREASGGGQRDGLGQREVFEIGDTRLPETSGSAWADPGNEGERHRRLVETGGHHAMKGADPLRK